ncbi:MAG: glycoside hydrolase family 13 protein [Saprospiraceae bacterium]|nr:glycoside hydrolase family 13 protein [Saprospiraceae bacterium]MDW8484186.1 glycoside hydrolase family 13 protein [Saprospiraceae bacterium]
MRRNIALWLLLFWSVGLSSSFSQQPVNLIAAQKKTHATPAAYRLDPPNWWAGMRHHQVEILLYRPNLQAFNVRLGRTRGVALQRVVRGDSPNYLFLTLNISPKAPPQVVPIILTHRDSAELSFTAEFPILARNSEPKAQGLSSRDVIYLLMPDRFANGDPSNDYVPGMLEAPARDSLLGRHGGDLKGILEHLDYLKDLGITALWLNPELENDQPEASYHGYAITDFYRIDRRLGTNELYRRLVRACHQRGLKVIRDVVTNHIGHHHHWMRDLPMRDWVNTWPVMTQTNYRATTLLDPYASEHDRKRFSDGWFVPSMPDLNQRNPHLATYLIQQAIWWIEYAGIDALRIDTYTYSDQAFMSQFCRTLRNEYPNLFLFGEIWEHGVIAQGFFADNQPMRRANFDSDLPSVLDFQLCFAIREALTREQGWTEGVAKLYYTLIEDYFYEAPMRNVVFIDNHDLTRFFSVVDEDLNRWKCGIAWLITTRGIPQIYYGTEILSTGFEAPSHGNIRKDFPGGWPNDPVNKFTPEGRTPQEQEAFLFLRTLLHYRYRTPALYAGRLMHFIPERGVYVYFRYDDAQTIMIILNTSKEERLLELERFAERLNSFRFGIDVVSGQTIALGKSLTIGPYTPLVLELKP